MQQANTLGPSITKDDQAYVEDLLQRVFAALPSERGVSPADMLDTYLLALLGQPRNAFRSVVYKLITGVLDPAIRFVPRPPELANHVRTEAARLRVLERPKALPAPSKPSAFIQAEKRWQGIEPIATGHTLDTWRQAVKLRQFPVGAVFACILGNVYGPQQGKTGDI